jgi:hypothetical protein
VVVMSPIFLNGVPEPGFLPLSGKLNFRPLTSTSFIGTLGNLAVMFGVSSRTGMSWLPRNLFRRSKKLRDFHEKTKVRRVQQNEAALLRDFSMTPSAPRRNASAIQQILASSQTQASSSSDSIATFVQSVAVCCSGCRRLPAPFEKPAELLRLARGADYTWFVWTVDRDINNALVLDWLVRTLCSATRHVKLNLADPSEEYAGRGYPIIVEGG